MRHKQASLFDVLVIASAGVNNKMRGILSDLEVIAVQHN